MKIKKRKLFEAVEDMGSDGTAGMGEDIDMNNVDITDMGEVFRTLNKLDEQTLNESSLSRLYRYIENNHVAFISAFLDYERLNKYYGDLFKKYKDSSNVARRINRHNNFRLERKLLGLEYNTIKVLGWYEYKEFTDDEGNFFPATTSKEESYVVLSKPNQDYTAFVDDMLKLAEQFYQQSILVVEQGGKNRTLHYTNGEKEQMGKIQWGKNAPFQTLINGRPFVVLEEGFEKVPRPRGYEVVACRMAAKNSKGILTTEELSYLLEGKPNFAWRDKEPKESNAETFTESIDTTLDALKALNKLDD